MADAKLDWKGKAVQLKVENVGQKGLEAMVFDLEGRTKDQIRANGQIDTSFMVNSVYTVTRAGQSTYESASTTGTYTNKAGEDVERTKAPQAALPNDAAALVAVGAEYAVFQESKKSFLYVSAEALASAAKGTVELVAREELHD
jgi:hypothetical protein